MNRGDGNTESIGLHLCRNGPRLYVPCGQLPGLLVDLQLTQAMLCHDPGELSPQWLGCLSQFSKHFV